MTINPIDDLLQIHWTKLPLSKSKDSVHTSGQKKPEWSTTLVCLTEHACNLVLKIIWWYGKEMSQNERTERAIAYANQTYCSVAFS